MAGRFNLNPSSATNRRQVSAPSVGSVDHQTSLIKGIFPLFPQSILGTHPFLKESQISEYDNDSSGDEQLNLIDLQPKEPVQLEVQKSTTKSFESQVQHFLLPPPMCRNLPLLEKFADPPAKTSNSGLVMKKHWKKS